MKSDSQILVLFLVLTLSGCASAPDKDHAVVREGVELRFEDFQGSSIPEFVARIRIESSLGNVMAILMDFESWPSWAYGCERVQVLQTIGYTEAYLYQVTNVPVIRDRDSIIHATSSSSNGEVVIEFEGAPNYCANSERSSCESVNQSKLVRVADLSGTFELKRVSANEVDVTWRQHQDPGGLVPDFLVRWMQGDIPVQSLSRLKALAESH